MSRDEITTENKRATIKREIRFRERRYPRLVEEGRTTKEAVEFKLRVWYAILEDYEKKLEEEAQEQK